MTLFILVTITVFGGLVVQSVVVPLLYIKHPADPFGLKGKFWFPKLNPVLFFKQKYLINKINNTFIITNLFYKNSQVIKNKEYFKIGTYDYMLYNDSTLIIPMINKKIFDNNYGTSFNLYTPKI